MTLESGLPEQISPDEDLVRFLFSKEYKTDQVKPVAFLPVHKERTTSIYRHGRDPLRRLWDIGDGVAQTRGKELKGAAFFKASDLDGTNLFVIAFEPPPRHGEISGWIWTEDPEDPNLKSQLLLQAMIIANACGAPFLRADNPVED